METVTSDVTFTYDSNQSIAGKEHLPVYYAKRIIWNGKDRYYKSPGDLARFLATPKFAWSYGVSGTITSVDTGKEFEYKLEKHSSTIKIDGEYKNGGYLTTMLDEFVGFGNYTFAGTMVIETKGSTPAPTVSSTTPVVIPDPTPNVDEEPDPDSDDGGMPGLFDDDDDY